jgi:hypothetical protein
MLAQVKKNLLHMYFIFAMYPDQTVVLQEKLDAPNHGLQGSSLLPEVESARLAMVREVLQILQEEIGSLAPSRSHNERGRLSTPASSMLQAVHPLEPLKVQAAPVVEEAALLNTSFKASASQEELFSSKVETLQHYITYILR